MYIAAYDIQSNQTYLINIPDDKVKEILSQFDNNLDQIASNLKLYNNKLLLMKPVNFLKNINFFQKSKPEKMEEEEEIQEENKVNDDLITYEQ